MSITKLKILNNPLKARYTVCIGQGMPDATDNLVKQVWKFPIGSQYTDLDTGYFYVRTAAERNASDWTMVQDGDTDSFSNDYNPDYDIINQEEP